MFLLIFHDVGSWVFIQGCCRTCSLEPFHTASKSASKLIDYQNLPLFNFGFSGAILIAWNMLNYCISPVVSHSKLLITGCHCVRKNFTSWQCLTQLCLDIPGWYVFWFNHNILHYLSAFKTSLMIQVVLFYILPLVKFMCKFFTYVSDTNIMYCAVVATIVV